MGNARKNLGLGLVCASFLFLFNPVFAVVDVLPDLIGYLLLCTGISQLADMNYHFEEALRYFKKMFIVSAVQLFSIFILFGFVTGRERPTAFLLFAFVFSVLEIVFLSHAYNQFFEGFIYLGSRMNATTVFHTEAQLRRYEEKKLRVQERLEKRNKKRDEKKLPPLSAKPIRPCKSNTARATSFTIFFVVLKATLTVLPEFSALTEHNVDEAPRFVFLYDFIALYRMIAIAIVLIVGIIWLIKILKYMRSILGDRPFMDDLTQKYTTEISPQTHIFVQRAIKLAFVIFAIGTFFSIDFYVESNSILPDFLCPLILLIALLLLKKHVKIPAYSYLLCVLYTVTSAITYLLSASFYSNYTLSLTDIRIEAYEAYTALCIVKAVDCVAFLLMIVCLFPVLSRIVKMYTGFAPASGANVQMQEKIRYIHGMLHKKLYILLILAALCSISGVAYILLVKNVTFMWIIDFLVCLAFSIQTVTTLNAISDEVQYKYLLN